MATRRIGVACATRRPGLSQEAAAQGRRATASLDQRARQAMSGDQRAGESATETRYAYLLRTIPTLTTKDAEHVNGIPPTFMGPRRLSIREMRPKFEDAVFHELPCVGLPPIMGTLPVETQLDLGESAPRCNRRHPADFARDAFKTMISCIDLPAQSAHLFRVRPVACADLGCAQTQFATPVEDSRFQILPTKLNRFDMRRVGQPVQRPLDQGIWVRMLRSRAEGSRASSRRRPGQVRRHRSRKQGTA